MSELPDGLPNTCLDCETTSIQLRGEGQLLIQMEKHGKQASIIVDFHHAAQPYFDILREQLTA